MSPIPGIHNGIGPDGEVDGLAEATWTGSNQFAYTPVVAASGAWRVRVLADGALAGTVEVPVAAPFALRRAELVDNRLEFAIDRTPTEPGAAWSL